MTPSRPLRADAERNRARLLEAASELFARKGLSVGLDEIARHAGVGVGTAYRRFPDKEELIDALFEQRLLALVAVADEALEHPDPWGGFVHFMEGAVDLHSRDQGFKELVFGTPRVARARAEMWPRVDALVRRAQDAGVLRTDVAATDIPLLQFALAALAPFQPPAGVELAPRHLRIVLDGLRTQPEPLPGAPLTPQQLQATLRRGPRPR
jgi:AcrR family transcriptional regulator